MKPGHLLLLVAALATAACTEGTWVTTQTQEVRAVARLKKVTHPKWGDIIWGHLTISGTTRKLRSADIDCFFLQVGNSKSGELWVDSYMDIQRGDYPAHEGEVSVDVYWPMKDFKTGTNTDLATAKLEARPRYEGSCFEFAAS